MRKARIDTVPSKPRFYCVTNPTRSDEAMAVFRVEKKEVDRTGEKAFYPSAV